jgi:hypothetical protein
MHVLKVSWLLQNWSLGDGKVFAFFLGFEDMHLVKCRHFIVLEFDPETKFSYSSQKAHDEYGEAK